MAPLRLAQIGRLAQGWSWQSYWITQAFVCWFLLPIVGAALTIPDLVAVLREAPRGRC